MKINNIVQISLSCLIIFLNLKLIFTRRINKRDFSGLFISSGTLWCGMGNVAKDCDQLGEHAETDNCCREHDSCPYTFSSSNNQKFNGYTSHFLSTISHCECDVIFSQCLHEKPYKPHSYEIWESYSSLNIKCYSYLPCNEDSDEHENIWRQIGERDSGECLNGTRILVFDSISDYSEFVSNLNLVQQIEINKRLISDKDRFVPENKVKYKCAHSFPNYRERIAENFESEFLNGHKDYVDLVKKLTNETKLQQFNKIIEIIKKSSDGILSFNNSNKETLSKSPNDFNKAEISPIKEHNVFQLNHKNVPKTIFLYNIIIPIGIILAIFVFLKFLITLYDKDNL